MRFTIVLRPLVVSSVAGLLMLSAALGVPVCQAANFLSAFYDGRTDELVVTLSYRGTNPSHEFTLRWGNCRTANGTSAAT